MKNRENITREFMKLMEDPETRSLMEEALELSAKINPDRNTNPAQNLEEFYDFLDWACRCMPWNVLRDPNYPSLYYHIDQSLNYFWFIFGQPLKRLEDKGYYLPTLEYHEPIASWLADFCDDWGRFLSSEESWNDEYFKRQFEDDGFGMNTGWYSKENIWKSYNEFFSRHLIDPSVRPIGDAEVVAPADSTPEGFWRIKDDGYVDDGVRVKSHRYYKVDDLLGPDSKYKGCFNGGIITHTYLNVNDYHRYHFPIDGKILEMSKIKGVNAVGGYTYFNEKEKLYEFDSSDTSWQAIETRDCAILETEFGLVACLPVGMSQVCSCNFEEYLKVGDYVKKGDPMGYFLFGGSDYVILFNRDVEVNFVMQSGKHMLMGDNYAYLSKK
ncbi:MAG: phosphatidylserine decarboxylase [Erysipelotrichaceae bacterium]|nr:phosphatidylserine decarboxylase [Erysipelotrichaceae bacterium]